mgnify:CR=1 FL=1
MLIMHQGGESYWFSLLLSENSSAKRSTLSVFLSVAVSSSDSASATFSPCENPVLREVKKYISLEFHAEVLVLIEELGLEVVYNGII